MLNTQFSQRLLKIAAVSGGLLSVLALLTQRPAVSQVVDAAVDSQRVTIQFAGVVGDEAFACDETYLLGAQNTAVAPLDFRMYVSEVALIDAEGNAVPLVLDQDGQWQHQTVALLDFEDRTGSCANGTTDTRAQVIGSVPAGDYRGLQFTVGVPLALNHADSTLAPSPLNLTSLWWNWNAGYKFARIDWQPMMAMANRDLKSEAGDASAGAHDAPHRGGHDASHGEGHDAHGGHGGHGDHDGHGGHGASQSFVFHLGSVGCQMDSAPVSVNCTLPNRPEVVLSDFDPLQNVVVADLAAIFINTDMTQNQAGTPVGCMSNPADADCGSLLQTLGLPFRDIPAGEQTVFSVR